MNLPEALTAAPGQGARAPGGDIAMSHHGAPRPRPTRPPRPRARSAGFTLLETGLATIIIGVGVLAVIEAQQAFLRKNAWSTHASTATFLANEIREMTRGFPRHDRFSGGIYFADPGDAESFEGWGPEDGENTIADLDDLDDLDGAVFGTATGFPDGFVMTRRFDGPIDAFGQIIPNTLIDGTNQTVEIEGVVQTVPLRGWTQIVQVEKVDPFDYSLVVPVDEEEVGEGGAIVRAVDTYPLRISVTVLYQGDYDDTAPAVTTVTWVVPP